MEKMPDPRKSPRELREECITKVHNAIYDGLNKVGQEQIESKINEIMKRENVIVTLLFKINVSVSSRPQTGKDFTWPGLSVPKANPELIAQKPRLRINQEVMTIVYSEFNRAGHEYIERAVNELIDTYGLSMGIQLQIEARINVVRNAPFKWPTLKTGPLTFR